MFKNCIEDFRDFFRKNTIKREYGRIKRGEAARRYSIYKKISYSEAFFIAKNTSFFKNPDFYGYVWVDRFKNPEVGEIEKCERRKLSSMKKRKCKKKEEEEEEEEEKILIEKILNPINEEILKKEEEISLLKRKKKEIEMILNN